MSVRTIFLSQLDNCPISNEPQPIAVRPAEEPKAMATPSDNRSEFEQAVRSPLRRESLLVRRAISGDEGAFEELTSGHAPRLRRIAYYVLHNREDAEEAVQDALLSAYRHLSAFRGQSLFSTWLTRIAINAAKMVRRRKTGRSEVSLDEILEADPPEMIRAAVDPRHNPEQACEAAEIGELIETGLCQLSPQLREAFRLRTIEGLSTEACLATLGIQRAAFKSRVRRARQRLASSLRPALLSPGGRQLEASEQ